MHVHPSSPNFATSPQSEESAAIKIQAGFRGYRVRKRLSCPQHRLRHPARQPVNGYHHRQQPSTSQSRRRHHQQMESPNSEDTSVSGNGRQFTATSYSRDEVGNGSEGSSIEHRCATKIQAGVRGFLVRKQQKVASDAATKIQAGFRGFKARKEAEKLKQK